MMPVMDGYELTRAIKSDPKLRSIPILILTALKAARETEKLSRLGADGFASKPFDSKELTAQIRKLIG
jgi:CheY-like chemotaxis protein